MHYGTINGKSSLVTMLSYALLYCCSFILCLIMSLCFFRFLVYQNQAQTVLTKHDTMSRKGTFQSTALFLETKTSTLNLRLPLQNALSGPCCFPLVALIFRTTTSSVLQVLLHHVSLVESSSMDLRLAWM